MVRYPMLRIVLSVYGMGAHAGTCGNWVTLISWCNTGLETEQRLGVRRDTTGTSYLARPFISLWGQVEVRPADGWLTLALNRLWRHGIYYYYYYYILKSLYIYWYIVFIMVIII